MSRPDYTDHHEPGPRCPDCGQEGLTATPYADGQVLHSLLWHCHQPGCEYEGLSGTPPEMPRCPLCEDTCPRSALRVFVRTDGHGEDSPAYVGMCPACVRLAAC